MTISDIHSAQIETLIKEKESKHEGDFDEKSLLTCVHGPALLTELAHEVNQLKKQVQKLTTIPPTQVHAGVLLRVMCVGVHYK